MAERPNVNPTPKQVFQQSPALVSGHRELMQSPTLEQSINCALLQMQRAFSERPALDGNGAAMQQFRLQGAYEFVALLRNLGETAELPKTTENKTKINYTA